MIELAAIFIQVCFPILAVAGIGWALDRGFGFDLRTLVKLNIYLFVPAFILVNLSGSTLGGRTGALVVAFTFCVIASMAAASWAVSRLRGDGRSRRAALQLSTMIYNSGNWGIPLMALAFPGDGPVIQLFVLATMNFAGFSLGVFLASQSGESAADGWRSLLPVLRLPSIYAILLALTFRVWGNPLESVDFVWQPLTWLSEGLVGFALLTLGVQLSQTRPPRLVGRLSRALGIRLLGGPVVAAGLVLLFGFRGELAAILILGAASPTAVNTALLAHEFDADEPFASAAVFYSTLLAAFVVTVLLALLRAGAIPWAVP